MTSNRLLILITVIVVLVLIIAGVVYFFFPKSTPHVGDTTTTTTPKTAPPKVMNVAIDSATMTSCTLKWDELNNGYYIYSGGDRTKTVTANTSSLTSFPSNTDFTFQISAFNSTAGEGTKSDVLTFQTSFPGTASSFTHIMNSTSAILNWTAVNYADSYKIAWALDYGGSAGTYTQIDVATATTYTVNGLSPITNYVFVLICVNKIGSASQYVLGTTTSA